MELVVEVVVHVHAGIEVGIHHITTVRTAKEFCPFALDLLAANIREPLAFMAAT
jgi:hypothetical protein